MRSFEKITKGRITKHKMTSPGSKTRCKMPRRVRALSFCVLCFVFCAFSSVLAAPLSIELVSEVTSIQPGMPFYVGLHLKHQEHYHTYWKFPGVVGVPTGMAWKLPEGWKAGPIEWPAPELVMMFQIKAQGYHDEVLLPMKITPPAKLEPGTKVTLQGKATWMCCGLDCNPGFADLSVTLPVEKSRTPLDARWENLFTKARAEMPKPLKGFTATATRTGERVTLRLTPKAGKNKAAGSAKSATAEAKRGQFAIAMIVNGKPVIAGAATGQPPSPGIFFTDDGYINPDKDQGFRNEGDALVIEMVISTYFTDTAPDELRGILWLRDGSLGKGAIIRAPFAK
jgi:thiol:disulfide interchange protein DsbD